jgi:hypothetical protein
MADINSIRVRMYRHGFGDCFLLQFFAGTSRQFTMLIDCGLKHNDSEANVSIEDVAADIKRVLRGKSAANAKPKLNVLVATHEHWDHVSGFHPIKQLFDDVSIDKIWMAWTEDPEDEEAAKININLRKGIKALKIAGEKIKASRRSKQKAGFYASSFDGERMLGFRNQFISGLEGIANLFGPLAASKTTKTSESGIKFKEKYKISIETQNAINHLRGLAKGKSGIQYFNPGDMIENIGNLPGLRIYVLGPPRNELLNKDTPSKGPKKEVYFNDGRSALMGFVNGVLRMGDAEEEYIDDGRPFGPDVDLVEAARDHLFLKKTYFDESERWRTIEDDWLDMAGALALQMDSDTNNTSLALAIEFIESGRILLFPGDAQVGSWLSWHDLEWKIKKDSGTETIKADQLLLNTVFYKASHHLSHNATLKEKGLELMLHQDLVAFVPEKEKQYNGIPHKPLLKRLREKTRGRVVISADRDYPAEKVTKEKPEALSTAEWNEFKKNLVVETKFIEFTVKG